MGLFGDAVGNLFIIFGKDEELHRLACAVDDIIQHDTDDKQGYETENNPSPVIKYEVTGSDDDDVTCHDHTS